MEKHIRLKDSVLTNAEKIKFIERVYNEKVMETKIIKVGDYYFIKGIEEAQAAATLDYYYVNAMKLEFNPAMADHSGNP